jgi:preprotein translocase subunit SecA
VFGFFKGLMGDNSDKELKRIQPLVERVNALEPDFMRLSDEELRDKTTEFRGRHIAGESLDSLLPEAFAAVRESARRTLGQRHYDVQLMGGAVLHQGKIAEMRTGEGKTLVATLPSYLNALAGKGVHVVTVNDYLAHRDRDWMSPVYQFLGMRVGVIQHDMDTRARRDGYAADITYGTNNEFGFDYLRDNMVWDQNDVVQRGLGFAIVDEIDNILIDEARTPLIISGPAEESTESYVQFARIVPRLREEQDFTIDEKRKTISLTEEGISKVERAVGVANIYDPENYEMTHYLDQAMKAQFLYRRDRDYVVNDDGEVVIVDEFTGRLMPGRRYSEGLHQAIEAKEGVRVQRENVTLATITFQNYFRMYEKLGGMTGTASTEAEEFRKIYNLDVIPIPTNREMRRRDETDVIYKTEHGKFEQVVAEITELHATGRPVLVGTTSIEKSEELASMLQRAGVPHEVLNAKQHEREATIIAQAGRPGAVTIATNMAGRGVDILLGGNSAGMAEMMVRRKFKNEEPPAEAVAEIEAEARAICEGDHEKVVELGGLHIIGTERHEARRIDNQLRGRAGRQGDPGSSRFYVSLEDDLMRRFGGNTISNLMNKLGLDDDVPLEHSLVTKSIENAQQKVESYNFDMRKHVVEYDDVMNKQREVVYTDRHKVLDEETLHDMLWEWVEREIDDLVAAYVSPHSEEEDINQLLEAFQRLIPNPPVTFNDLRGTAEEVTEVLKNCADEAYMAKEEDLGPDIMRQAERVVVLRIIDTLWVRHLTALDDLRHGIGLRAYGQRDPLVEYKVEAARMFDELQRAIQHDVSHTIYHVTVNREPQRPRPQPMMTNREAGQPAKAGRKIGRNDLCYCGSGKKYKYCHGR